MTAARLAVGKRDKFNSQSQNQHGSLSGLAK